MTSEDKATLKRLLTEALTPGSPAYRHEAETQAEDLIGLVFGGSLGRQADREPLAVSDGEAVWLFEYIDADGRWVATKLRTLSL